jgi:predicted DNA-binding transcriptional regulator AlpA
MFDPLIPQPLTLNASGVAQLLGLSEETFLKRRAELEAEHQFPRRIPGVGKWSRASVAHWINSSGLQYAPLAAGHEADTSPDLQIAISTLEGAYTSPRRAA